ncbi:hypothetical protein TRFO_24902 [Tritrichomonas foetus]|uniref:Uncharacterized protein n=1 Tax=Tritrichomonas foetus TaxID=1144522 RepID=A0A1J4KBV0_9EUKA|nr:hypothetical protein TRFO_24902 [Tritrichomonas foetus]|eukprot:OHT06941.1 hypothetical protein TRFO_24902 [Tritrichomonas foetus]
MNRDSLFQTLSQFCKEADEANDGFPSNHPEDGAVWAALYQIALNDPKRMSIFYPLVKQFSLSISTFQDFPSPDIESSIDILSNNSNDYETRYKAAVPLISLLTLLPFPKFMQIISSYIDLIYQKISIEPRLPVDALDLLETIDYSLIPDETIDSVFDYIKDQMETEKSAAVLFLTACFIDCILDYSSESVPIVCEWIINNIKKESQIHKIGAFYLLEKSAIQLGNNISSIPKHLFDEIAQYLANFDNLQQDVYLRAHKATRQLIANNVFATESCAKLIIEQFSKYPEDKLYLFFKLLQRFLDNFENPKIEIVQLIFDFVCDSITNSKIPYVKAKCLESISQIAAIDKMYVEDIYEDAFETAVNLMTSDIEYLTEVTNFFLMVSQSFPGSKIGIINQKLNDIANSLTNEETGTKKQRMERAASLAAIIQNNSYPEIVKAISKFVVSTFDTIVGGELFYICSVIIALRNQLEIEDAKIIFSKLEELAINESITPRLNAILHTMKKILTKFDIDASNLIDRLMNGNIAYLGKMPLFTCQDEKTMIFYFIAAFIRKSPLKSGPICEKLVECIPNVRNRMIPAILEPLEAGVHSGVTSRETIQKLYQVIVELVEKLTLDEEEELIACIEILSEIGRSNPDVFNGKQLFELLNGLFENFDEAEVNETPPLGPIIRFALELCTLKYVNIEYDQNFIKKLVGYLPLPPHVNAMDSIIKLLVENVLVEKEKLGFLTLPSLMAITNLLLMTESDLSEYEFDQQLIVSMKNILKKMVREDRTLERQITQNYKSQRQKLNRFSRLLK